MHYATLVTYANPHPQFMFELKYYINFNLQRHKRPQIFMQSEVFIFSGQEWCHCILANDPTYDHFFVADCFFLYNKTEPGPELLHSAQLVLYSCEFSASIHATVRCTSINFVRLTENL